MPTGKRSTPNTVATLMFQTIRKRSEPSRIHLLLNMPPRFWAAFLVRMTLCRGAQGCARVAFMPTWKASMNSRLTTAMGYVAAAILLGGCASGPPQLPYPAFVQVDELNDIFMASLPGVRAKQLSGDPQTRRTSNRVDLPKD